MQKLVAHTVSRLRRRSAVAFRALEVAAVHLTESEAPWWPFGFLRPRPEERFSTALALVLSFLQGLPVGLFLMLIDGSARRWAGTDRAGAFLLGVCAAVFVVNRTTLAVFWNRRAARLEKLRERRETWARRLN